MLHAKAAFSGISTNDISKSKQFYTETLGLKLIDDKMGLTLDLPNGSGQLFVYEKLDHQAATFTVLNFVIDDVVAGVKELKSQGVTFEQYDFGNGMKTDENGVMAGPEGQGPKMAWFKDPAGNVLGLLHKS